MANIWLTVSLTKRDTGEALGSKDFLVNFADPNPRTWFANAQTWAAIQLGPHADMAILEAQEAVLVSRRSALEEKARAQEAVAAEPVVEEVAPIEEISP